MSDIKVVLSRSTSWRKVFTKILLLFEKVNYDHCAIIVDGEYQYVYEATIPVSKASRLEQWLSSHEIVEEYYLGPATPEKLVWLRRHLGKRYSIMQLLVMALGIVTNKFDKLIANNSINGSKFLVCTELVALYLAQFHGSTFDETPDTISLIDIKKELKEIQWQR